MYQAWHPPSVLSMRRHLPHVAGRNLSISTSSSIPRPRAMHFLTRSLRSPSLRKSTFERSKSHTISGTCFLGQTSRRTFFNFSHRPTPPKRQGKPTSPSRTPKRLSEWLIARSMNGQTHLYGRHYSSNSSGSSPMDSANLAFYILLALNVIPYTISTFASFPDSSPTVRKLSAWIRQNFTFTYAIADSKPWTFLTAGFMHANLLHLLFNMLTLRTGFQILGFTTSLAPAQLVSLHLAAVLGGTLVSYLSTGREVADAKSTGNRMRQFQAEQRRYVGASAGVSGVLVAASCIAPRFPITIMFIPVAVPLAGATAGFLFLDAYLLGNATSFVAHEGHLGGAVAGALYYLARLRR